MREPLSFRLGSAPGCEIDMSALLPEHLAQKSIDAIKRIRLRAGKKSIAVGDIFDVSGQPDLRLSISAVSPALRRIGHGMSAGEISITGQVGDELGRAMRGGEIRIKGNAGDYVGCDMRGGKILISGRSGDFTGGALPYTGLGLRNGIIRVGRDAGRRVGHKMRRGLIIINDACGSHCATNMIAGTIVVGGKLGVNAAMGMRRGSVIVLDAPASLPPTFKDCGSYRLPIMALLSKHIAVVDRKLARRLNAVETMRRFAGDVSCGGQGEVLVANH